jgi:ribonuclease VapC
MFEIAPPGRAEMEAAYAAFVSYGRGSGHPANLNFGDLFAYALAKVREIPLLFKGDDFVHRHSTGVRGLRARLMDIGRDLRGHTR